MAAAISASSSWGALWGPLDLGTGRWVSWQHDVVRQSCRSAAAAAAAAAAGDGGAASAAPAHHVCSSAVAAAGAGGWARRSGRGASGGNCIPNCDAALPGCCCSSRGHGRLFVASPRTCALQYLTYWHTYSRLRVGGSSGSMVLALLAQAALLVVLVLQATAAVQGVLGSGEAAAATEQGAAGLTLRSNRSRAVRGYSKPVGPAAAAAAAAAEASGYSVGSASAATAPVLQRVLLCPGDLAAPAAADCSSHRGAAAAEAGTSEAQQQQQQQHQLGIGCTPQQSSPFCLVSSQQVLAAVFGSAWQLPQTAPCTPGAASWGVQLAGAAAAAAGGGVGISARKVPLKAMCCAVIEVLCRRHVALLDQEQHLQDGASSKDSTALPSCDNNGSSSLEVAAAAAAALQKVGIDIRKATRCSSGVSTWLQRMLTGIGASSTGSSDSSGSTEAWRQLQQLPNAAFADKLRSSQLPAVLPGRVLAQFCLMASMGRDPVNSLEGLHVAAAQAELLQLLQQQAEAAAASHLHPAAAAAQQEPASVAVVSGYWQPGVLALAATAAAALGASTTAQQLLQGMPALQSHCYQLALPAVQLAEQLAADCKTQLMGSCGWALLEHVRDSHALAQQQQQQLISSCGSKDGNGVQLQPGISVQLSSSSLSGAAAAAAAEPAARHLAERLAAALASIHQAVFEAYGEYYTIATCSSSRSSSSRSSSSRSSPVARISSEQEPALKASQAVPLAKPFDVLQLLPGLLSEGRGRPAARMASLSTCTVKTAKVQQQVQDLLHQRQQQQLLGTLGAPSGAADSAAAGIMADAASAEMQVLSGLVVRLQLLVDGWRAELEQEVVPALVQVLPVALLAAIELTYLGPLPAATQQQLLAYCRQLLTAAAAHTQLQLVHSSNPLWQQLQHAAAAAAVAAAHGQPLLVLDPWQLLPQLLAEGSTVLGAAAADRHKMEQQQQQQQQQA
ncbi:hypothetical protein COO60DRAFT_1662222 [Scenedesmus sp. NREL 46B-D3]|nr:hypothetical protein COO60DRAFT_1662222 [Scenedesmus sp. NREL 46B-D3]